MIELPFVSRPIWKFKTSVSRPFARVVRAAQLVPLRVNIPILFASFDSATNMTGPLHSQISHPHCSFHTTQTDPDYGRARPIFAELVSHDCAVSLPPIFLALFRISDAREQTCAWARRPVFGEKSCLS